MKRLFKILICTILTTALLLPMAVYGEEASAGNTKDPASASEDSQAQNEKEEKKDIMILYTSDIHCGVDNGFGYAGLEQIRKREQEKGYDVILVDNGDNIQGDALGLLTKGEALLDLMNRMGYSIAIPGNHEFDYGIDNFLSLAERAEFEYISCNFQYKGENVFDPYVIREIGGRKIAFVGVTTPTSLTASTPAAFQDENGNFVYSFLQDESGEAVYNAVQKAVDDARKEGAEYVIVLGHMGNDEAFRPWTYADVISHTSGIDAFLDGHSHDTDQVIMKNKEGKKVPRSACGTGMQCIGWCRILMEEKIAVSGQDLTINDPVAVDPKWGKVRMVRRAETNLADLCTDALRVMTGADLAVLGGGGIRVDIPAGDVTMKSIYEVFPFANEVCVVDATGQQILDALEWGARSVPDENGGFLQTSGMTYEIHTYIDHSCTKDENGMFTGVEGERRVKNVMVGGSPIDPEAHYKVAGTDYYLLMNGDGHTAFNKAERADTGGILDTQVLSGFITEELGGVIGEEYSDPRGQGRIVIVEEKPAE